ncbi:hypothetical protein PG990_010546 [Apiospora arundinis]
METSEIADNEGQVDTVGAGHLGDAPWKVPGEQGRAWLPSTDDMDANAMAPKTHAHEAREVVADRSITVGVQDTEMPGT